MKLVVRFLERWPLMALLIVTSLTSLLGGDLDDLLYPELSWKEADFQDRFLARYGVNGYIEPQMDLFNFTAYKLTLKEKAEGRDAVVYLKTTINSMEDNLLEPSPALHYLLGCFLYEAGEYEESIDQYIIAIEKYPSYLRAYANLGFVLMERGEYERALPVLLKSVELGANEAQVYGIIGFVYAQSGLYENALISYRLAIMMNPRNKVWKNGILSCLEKMKRYEDALSLLDEMIAFDYDDSSSWMNRALVLSELGRTDAAIVNIQVAHLLGGESFRSQMFLGRMLFDRMHYSSAVGPLIRCSEIMGTRENLEEILPFVSRLFHVGEYAESKRLLAEIKRKALSLGEELNATSLAYIDVAFLLREEKYEEALEILEPLIEDEPANGQLLVHRAKAFAALGMFEDAEMTLVIAQTIKESAYIAYLMHSDLLIEMGEIERALSLLREAYDLVESYSLLNHINELEDYVKRSDY